MSNTVLFIDAKVTDYETLLANLAADVEVHILNAEEDGVLQMAAILKGRTGLDSIQIISHGSSGALSLGSSILDNDNLSLYADALGQIGSSLSETGDMMLYGCNVAYGEIGLSFINGLAQYTGADVAASDDLTGNTALGGDWVLETSIGSIEPNTGFGEVIQIGYSHTLANENVSQFDISDAFLLSSYAYENSDSLVGLLANTIWQPLGSDPVPQGRTYEGEELPTPDGVIFWDSYFGEGLTDSNFLFDSGNVQAFISRNTMDGSLAIAFRGTDKNPWWSDSDAFQDWWHGNGINTFEPEYNQFRYLVESVDTYIAQNNIGKVIVTGHSLGGVMAEWFMAEHSDSVQTKYLGITFGSPGDITLAGREDSRLINFGHTGDPVVNSADGWLERLGDVAVDLTYINGYTQSPEGAFDFFLGDKTIHSRIETVKVFKTSGILEKKNTEKLEKC